MRKLWKSCREGKTNLDYGIAGLTRIPTPPQLDVLTLNSIADSCRRKDVEVDEPIGHGLDADFEAPRQLRHLLVVK